MTTAPQLKESTAVYTPKTASEKRFVQKHFGSDGRPNMAPGFEGDKDRTGNTLELYRGVTKPFDRTRFGYAPAPSDADEKVYEGKTHRYSDNAKHKNRAIVKKFLIRKQKKDERRLQEGIIIPKDEFQVEIVDGTINEANQADVRALRGQITHKVFVGLVGTATDQNHYCVQDSGGRRFHVFTNKELGKKGDRVDLHVQEYKKGGGILSVAKKNLVKEETQVDETREPKNAHDVYLEHQVHLKQVLKDIGTALDAHAAKVVAPRSVISTGKDGKTEMKTVPGKAHWGHVGDMKRTRSDLENVRDYLSGSSEYGAHASMPVAREETENNKELVEDLKDVQQRMMAANKIHILGIKHGDKQMQAAAKTRLQQLAKQHADFSNKQDASEEFLSVVEDIQRIIADEPVEQKVTAEQFIEAMGEDLATQIIASLDLLEDEDKKMVESLIEQGQWEQLAELYTTMEESE